MKLSMSNIAWNPERSDEMFKLLNNMGYEGIEIAPTAIFPNNPYDDLTAAKSFSHKLYEEYKLKISSMQSIWYGKKESIFGNEEEVTELQEYTLKAVKFANRIGCKNLVFGCPKNRVLPADKKTEDSIVFFRTIAGYAEKYDVNIAIEANPPIYNTNFVNTTKEALDLIDMIDLPNFKLNLDFGTIIENAESLDILKGNVYKISHVHISEPMLKPILVRNEHKELIRILENEGYTEYISIEMGKGATDEQIEKILKYVGELIR